MSTKIWEAYRLPKKNLNEFLLWVQQNGRLYILRKASALFMRALSVKNEAHEQLWRKAEENAGIYWGLETEEFGRAKVSWYRGHVFEDELEGKIKAASLSMERSAYDLDGSLNIWFDTHYAYVIPYGVLAGLITKGYEVPTYLKDYHYQNSADKSANISDRAWDARYKKWTSLCLNDWDQTRLVYHVFEGTNYNHIFWLSQFLCMRESAHLPLAGVPAITFEELYTQLTYKE